MHIQAALSADTDARAAAREVVDRVSGPLGGRCDLAIVFASPDHADRLEAIVSEVDEGLHPAAAVAAVAQGVVGPATEAEDGPALSLWAASWDDGGTATPFRTWAVPSGETGVAVLGWPDTRPGDVVLLFADPYSYPVSEVVRRVSDERGEHQVVGGLLTAGPHGSRYAIGTTVHEGGAVGVVCRDVDVRTVVSQGCRPIGEPMVVTRAEGNAILELAGQPAVHKLRSVFAESDDADKALMQVGLHVGIVAEGQRDRYERGDFLIRGVMGADPERDAVIVGDVVEVGAVVQFQVRDPLSAREDLDAHLLLDGGPAEGALLFTCNGRGERFFGLPNQDVEAIEQHLEAPVAGAFCAGEIGPVGSRSHLHGFTASMALFGGRSSADAT